MSEIRLCRSNCPCKDCPDRKPPCSDHCTKPEFLAWKAEKETIRKNKDAYNGMTHYTVNKILDSRRPK